MITEKSLESYCQRAMTEGATHALLTSPQRIITAPWVRWKCQFGCSTYGRMHCCPPLTPAPEETRRTLDSYNRLILFHLQWTKGVQSGRDVKKYLENIMALEKELFFEGYYQVFALLAGPCTLCKACAMLENRPCHFRDKMRPSMEACGIDVYRTAHEHGLPINTLRAIEETRNIYCLLLVD